MTLSRIIVVFFMTVLPLFAAAQPLTPSEINELKAQLVKAQGVHTALDARVKCYLDKDTSLQTHSSQLQQSVGDLHQQEQILSSKLIQMKSEAEEFRHDFKRARQEMDNLEVRMNSIEAQIQMDKATLDDCKNRWWTINYACDLTGEIVGLNSSLRQLSAEKNATNIRRNALQQQFREVETRRNLAINQFQTIQKMSAQNKLGIAAAEAKIKVIKTSLAEIRIIKQDYSTELIKLQDTFNEFDSLDTHSDRRSIVRRLRSESAYLKDLLVKAQVLLDNNGLLLPSGKRICTN